MYDLAKALSQEEISRHPHNTHPLYIYARLAQEMMSQRPTEAAVALESYQKAIATSPKRQQLHYGLARLYLQLGRLDDAIAVFKTVRDFDLENGIGYWNYGVTMLYDKGSTDEAARQIGAEEVRKAMQAKWAYVIQDSRELFPLFDAYIILRDAENLQKTIENLQGYPLATANIYAQLAMKMQVLGLTELRDQILTKAETLAPGTKDEYDRMLDPQDSDTVTLTPAPEPTNTVATSAGSGPRR